MSTYLFLSLSKHLKKLRFLKQFKKIWAVYLAFFITAFHTVQWSDESCVWINWE